MPTDAYAKLTFRLVGKQDPAAVQAAVTAFFADRAAPTAEVTVHWEGVGVRPLYVDTSTPAVAATARALGRAFDGSPVLHTREGGSGPEAELTEYIGAPLVFLGVMTPDDQIHAPNESARVDLLLRGCEAVGYLWSELAGTAE